jgi:hypothetical protein
MAGLAVAGRNAVADGLAAVSTFVGLLDTSGTELTGGTPAYARKAVTWNAAAAGIRTSVAQLLFDVPVASVAFYGLYSALTAGTNYAILPVQGGASSLPQATTFDTATDVFTSYAHGLANADRVILSDVSSAGLQATFDENTVYFVVASAANTFQLSLTSGGAAVTTTVSFEAFVTKAVVETFAAQGQFSIAAAALAIDANLF